MLFSQSVNYLNNLIHIFTNPNDMSSAAVSYLWQLLQHQVRCVPFLLDFSNDELGEGCEENFLLIFEHRKLLNASATVVLYLKCSSRRTIMLLNEGLRK